MNRHVTCTTARRLKETELVRNGGAQLVGCARGPEKIRRESEDRDLQLLCEPFARFLHAISDFETVLIGIACVQRTK